jgi:hypothetical protein
MLEEDILLLLDFSMCRPAKDGTGIAAWLIDSQSFTEKPATLDIPRLATSLQLLVR